MVLKGRINAENNKYKNVLEDVWSEIIDTFGKHIVFQDR